MPGIEPGASYMQSMRSTTELHPQRALLSIDFLWRCLTVVVIGLLFWLFSWLWERLKWDCDGMTANLGQFLAALYHQSLWRSRTFAAFVLTFCQQKQATVHWQKRTAMAGNRTRVNCLEGSYAYHYTTIAPQKAFYCKFSNLSEHWDWIEHIRIGRYRSRGNTQEGAPTYSTVIIKASLGLLWHWYFSQTHLWVQ